MSTNPLDAIRDAMETHLDGSMRVVERKWHAFCDCGADLGDTAGPLVDSSYDQAGRLHQRHLGEAIRDALADAGLLVEPDSETRPPLPLDMGTEPCETPMPGRPDLHCDRPLFHAHHGAPGTDGTRTLWVDTYTPTVDRVEPEVTSRRYEWGERTEDGEVLFTALSGLVDDGWRPLRRYPTARLVRRTRTEYGTVFGPWQSVDEGEEL